MPILSELYTTPADMPETIALFPLGGALLLPGTNLPLNIFEPRYLAMVEAAMAGSRLIGMIQPQNESEEDDPAPALETVGTAGRITTYAEVPDGRYLITLTGICRFRITEELSAMTPFRQAIIDCKSYATDLAASDEGDDVNRDLVVKTLSDYVTAKDLSVDWDAVAKTGNADLVNSLAMMSPFGTKEKQALLEAETVAQRAEVLVALTEMDLAQTAGSDTPHLQ